jgi:hypothetical protein
MCPLDAKNVHNMGPHCGWAVQKRFWALPDTRWLGKWAVKEKKEADNTFVLPAIRTLLVI